MYEYIIGDVKWINQDYIVLENGGIGYKIFTSYNSSLKLDTGMKDIMMYTYYNLRDDGVYLYGFTDEIEINIFKLLITVSKIGPKVAIGILSALTPNQIKMGIAKKDVELLCKAPGVGKKTAERMILELKDKIEVDDFIDEESDVKFDDGGYVEAVDGLVSLGYTKFEVEKTLKNVDVSGLGIEEIIRFTLKELSKN